MEKIGDYTILKKIATGGMAEVYLAKSNLRQDIEKLFAVKCLLPKYSCSKEYIDLFINEARLQINMSHSNLVSIFDFGTNGLKFFIAMEYVDGITLHTLFRNAQTAEDSLSVADIIYSIKESAQGLDYSHNSKNPLDGKLSGIVHGDISPDNIMVTVDGEVKVIDFGVSKVAGADSKLTAGKKRYMSQEQSQNGELAATADIYSLGRTFLELMRSNVGCDSPMSREDHEQDLADVKGKVSPEIFDFISRMLARSETDAYQKMEDVARDLTIYLNTNYPAYNKKELGEKTKRFGNQELLVDHLEMTGTIADEIMDYTCVTVNETEVQTMGKPPKRKKVRRRRRVFKKKAG